MLSQKKALITGSTSGIGLGIARALAEAGCDVMLNGMGEAGDIERERQRIMSDFAAGAHFNGADLSKATEIASLIDSATAELGRVDILVNNAGIQFKAPVEEFPPERWDAILAINLS